MAATPRLYRPLSGRLIVRQTGAEEQLLIGVVHLPQEFDVKEGALYLLMLCGGNIEVVDQRIDEGLPEEIAGFGVSSYLTSACWRGTSVPATLTVRFIKAFAQSGWVMFGPSRKPIVPPERFHRGHAWMDVSNGQTKPIEALFDAAGEGVSSFLSGHAVWPDANGVLHTAPTMESNWRPVYVRYWQLIARLGAGEITQGQFAEEVRCDAKLFHIRSLSIDMSYASYLAKLRELGAIEDERARTTEELTDREALSARIIRELV